MNTSSKWRTLVRRLANKAYRDAFVAQHSTIGLPFQIRAMRDDREWTQRELGERVGMAQETISLLENPGYGRFTLRTLNRLAAAFDVGLLVRFVPFSRLVNEMTNVSAQDLAVPDFARDPGLAETEPASRSTAMIPTNGGISDNTPWIPVTMSGKADPSSGLAAYAASAIHAHLPYASDGVDSSKMVRVANA